MKKYIFSIIFILGATSYGITQDVIRGIVQDENGLGLMAATCFLKHDRSKVGISNLEGHFQIAIDNRSLLDTVEVRYLGYENQYIAVKDFSSTEVLAIKMGASANMMSEVLITARNPISEDFSVEKIERLDVYFNPLSKADPLNSIQMLPSSTDTEESASPSLRGSSPGRTIVIVDGVPIRNPVRYTQLNGTGNFSIFNTELLESMDVYAGNPPLIYGNSTAGLVDIRLRNKSDNDGLSITTALSTVGAMWKKTLNDEKGYLNIYGNHGRSELFTQLNGSALSSINSFYNTDVGLRYRTAVSDRMDFSLFNYASKEGYDVNYGLFAYQGVAVGDQVRNYTVAKLEWGSLHHQWTINAGADFSKSDFTYGALRSDANRKDIYTALNYKWIEEDFVLQMGVNHSWNNDKFDESLPMRFYEMGVGAPINFNQLVLSQSDLQIYGYFKKYIGDFTLSAALRGNVPRGEQDFFWSRQLAAKYAPNDIHSLLFSLGKYHNYNYPTSENMNLALLESEQYSLEYQYNTEKLQLSMAGYIKKEDNLLDRYLASSGISPGIRHIRGIEFAMRKNIGKKWILDIANTFLDVNVRTDEFEFKASNDLAYFFKLGLTLFNNDVFNAGLSYVARPGKYYTDIIDGAPGPSSFLIPVFEGSINGSQYSAYNNISVTFNRQIDIGEGRGLVLFAVLNNLLNTKNQSYATYSSDYAVKDYEYYGQRWVYFGGMVYL